MTMGIGGGSGQVAIPPSAGSKGGSVGSATANASGGTVNISNSFAPILAAPAIAGLAPGNKVTINAVLVILKDANPGNLSIAITEDGAGVTGVALVATFVANETKTVPVTFQYTVTTAGSHAYGISGQLSAGTAVLQATTFSAITVTAATA
jgi:hypothetical protein